MESAGASEDSTAPLRLGARPSLEGPCALVLRVPRSRCCTCDQVNAGSTGCRADTISARVRIVTSESSLSLRSRSFG
eukprot:788710-Alexandrium_andersonii.AAC.1